MFLRVYLLNKRMPDKKKHIYPCVHKIKNKTNKLANLKERRRKRNATGLETKRTASYPLGYRGIVIFFMHKSNCATL